MAMELGWQRQLRWKLSFISWFNFYLGVGYVVGRVGEEGYLFDAFFGQGRWGGREFYLLFRAVYLCLPPWGVGER